MLHIALGFAHSSYNKSSKFLKIGVLSVLVFLFLASPRFASAATRTWSGATSNLWSVASNWVEGVAPVAGDDLVFPLTASNKSNSNNITAGTSFNSITFQGTGYGLSGNSITLGSTGITSNYAGASNGISLAIVLAANSNITVTNSNETLTISGVISDGGSGYGLTKDGGGKLVLYTDSFSGDFIVKDGEAYGKNSNSNWFGTGTITLGDAAGGSNTAIISGSSITIPNPIVLASNTTGDLILKGYAGTGFSGGVTGNNNLNIQSTSGYTMNVSGAINNVGTVTNSELSTGGTTISGSIGSNVTEVIQNSASSSLVLSGNNSFGALTILKGTVGGTTNATAFGAGTITLGNSAGGSDAATLSGGSNLTFANSIVLASNTTGALTITNGGSCDTGDKFSGDITGTNNLTIGNYLCGTRTLSFIGSSINNVGSITLIGREDISNKTSITSNIGSNVTSVIDNMSGSSLILSGNNSFGALTILKGTVIGQTNATAFGAGTITLGNSAGGSDNAYLQGGTDNIIFSNPIVLASNTTGILTVGNSGTYNVTFSGGVTGTNTLTVKNNGSGSKNVIFSGATVNHIGPIVNTDSSSYNATQFDAVIGSNVTDIINNGIGHIILTAPNTFSGGVFINSGDVQEKTNSNVFGNATITLGNSAGGNSNASLIIGTSGLTIPNPIVLASNTTGTLSIFDNTCVNGTFTGGITGNNNLNIASGGCSKTITFSTGEINNSGTVTNAESTNAGYIIVNSVIGSNVTGLIQNGVKTSLTLAGNNSTISGDVTIATGTLALSGTTNLNVAGNWSNTGTFTPNQGTVTFTSGTHTISGTNSFYNLTLSPHNTVSFSTSTTQTISNTFSCTGTAGNAIIINSDTPGTQATLSMGAGQTANCDYLDLTDSNASGGATWNAGSNSMVHTNVTGWLGGMTVPDAPTGLAGTASNDQISLTWAAPVNNGGSAITDYVVEYKLSTDSSWTIFADGVSAATSATVTGLVNGQSYDFRVSAVNAVGEGVASGVISDTPITVPGAPTGVLAEAGDTQATVTFTAPVSNGGSAITGYTVTSNPGNITATGASSPITVTGLTNLTPYTFTVTATNAAGTGPASTASNSVTPASVPGVPVNLAATALSSSVALTWSAPVNNGGSAITDYVVEYKLSSGGVWSVFADGVSASTGATVIGLSDGTSYDFRVSAVNAIGQGSPSNTVTAIPGEPAQVIIQSFPNLVVPDVTADIRITNEGSASYEYQYSWCVTDASDNFCGGGNDVLNGSAAKLIQPGSNFDTTLSLNLPTPAIYWLHLSVAYGSASSTASQSFTTIIGPPDAPTIGTATAGAGEATVSFSAPTQDHGSTITAYTVTSVPDGFTATGISSPIIITGLTNGTPYTFTVTATNAAGTGPASTASNSVTPLAVPGAINSLATTVDTGQAILSWSAPTDDGGSAITDYVVEYKKSSDSTWAIFADGVSAATSATVTGLVNGQSYDFRVSAMNVVGTGPSLAVSATLPETQTLPHTTQSSSGGDGGFIRGLTSFLQTIVPVSTSSALTPNGASSSMRVNNNIPQVAPASSQIIGETPRSSLPTAASSSDFGKLVVGTTSATNKTSLAHSKIPVQTATSVEFSLTGNDFMPIIISFIIAGIIFLAIVVFWR